jgi:hypothetical protein
MCVFLKFSCFVFVRFCPINLPFVSNNRVLQASSYHSFQFFAFIVYLILLPFHRFPPMKPVLPLSNAHGSQVKDQGRRQCCHDKHETFPYRPTRECILTFLTRLVILLCGHKTVTCVEARGAYECLTALPKLQYLSTSFLHTQNLWYVWEEH